MSDYAALHRAVLTEPGEDTPRLVLADWYGENGQPERAEFVRVQVELARCGPVHPLGHTDFDKDGRAFVNDKRECARDDCPRCTLTRRERELLTHLDDWYPPACKTFGRYDWDRGFISAVTCTAADFLAHADALVWPPTVACDRCGHKPRGRRFVLCYMCKGTGRVPNPDPPPPTAQPVRTVRLTTLGIESLVAVGAADWWQQWHPAPGDDDYAAAFRRTVGAAFARRWPGIEFVIPDPGTFTIPVQVGGVTLPVQGTGGTVTFGGQTIHNVSEWTINPGAVIEDPDWGDPPG